MKKIVLVTYGTLGDFNPYLAVATALKSRGYKPIIAAAQTYRVKAESRGIDFFAISPNMESFNRDARIQKLALKPITGTEFIVRKILLPSLSESYSQLEVICRDADLIVGHFLGFAVPLVAERLKLPWLQVYLHPTNLFSVTDPPILPFLREFGPSPYKIAFAAIRGLTSHWMNAVHDLRKSLGLPSTSKHPLLESWSPYGTMVWFSKLLADRQPDWPPNTVVTGYPFLDSDLVDVSPIDSEMEDFVQSHNPVVFTLGSTAVLQPRQFYEVSARAAADLGVSALLIGIEEQDIDVKGRFDGKVRSSKYLAYSKIFPHARMTVHHGGIGSISQSLLAGKQMLVVPFAWDQPDNALRIERLGAGLQMPLRKYKLRPARAALARLLEDEAGRSRVREFSTIVREEHGAEVAADTIEAFLKRL